MPAYQISGTDRVYEWFGNTQEPGRREALIVWTKAVCADPELVTSGYVVNTQRRRRINYSDIPAARTRVSFIVVDVPARCVHILRIDDDQFEQP